MRIVLERPLTMLILSAGLTLVGHATGEPRAVLTKLQDQRAVAVTIYNQQLALIKDTRDVKLDKGINQLAFRDVSAQIKSETALLRSLTHPRGFYLIEQNFDYDLLSPKKLLQKYVGKKVHVVKTHPTTGVESMQEARVLSAHNGVVLMVDDHIETGIPGRIVYDEVPHNLRDRPTLTIELHSGTDQPQQLELSYLTGGLGWKADYVAELNQKDTQLDLNGWVTLTNQSGSTYRNAQLQLVAGDVHRVKDQIRRLTLPPHALADTAATKEAMVEESLFEYHLYTLERPTTIAEQQTKQVALLSAGEVPVNKEYVLQGKDYYYRGRHGDLGRKLKVGVFVEFTNTEQANLGIPLPKVIVRVYKRDSRGNAQFVGEDRIDHTPKNEQVRLKLGDAFDITAEKKQTNFKKLAAVGKYDSILSSSYEIVLKNAKETPVTVVVLEPVPGDWKITEESHPHTKATARTAVWKLSVPAQGKTTLTYTVNVRK